MIAKSKWFGFGIALLLIVIACLVPWQGIGLYNVKTIANPTDAVVAAAPTETTAETATEETTPSPSKTPTPP
ncbi:MAG: hypothetical protein KGJ80_16860, partial [Chloroflexota bacterium]|nr:hypothetical protein [Chloroflexota bacterium]